MKNFILVSLLLSLLGYSKSTVSQNAEKPDSLGLPGDNLNLYAVLQLFQESKTLDEFEKKLNQESLNVNNLDLNNDDKIDYIKVIDNITNGAHAIVLQTPINDKETQDIAVIEVEKDKSGNTVVQIVGNEELYGKDYIIEPKENDSSSKLTNNSNKKKTSDTTISADGKTVIINNNTTNNNYSNGNSTDETPKVYIAINQWPLIQYVYAPGYVGYVSPWYWSNYPGWWNPWTPWYWNRYYHYHHHQHYYGYYQRTFVYRNQGAQTYYGPRRSSSTMVHRNRTEGRYNTTYKREPIKVDENRPSRPNPGYIQPTVRPTPNTRPTPRLEPSPSPRPNTNPVNPRINRPTQQPRQNAPMRQPSQNNGGGRRR